MYTQSHSTYTKVKIQTIAQESLFQLLQTVHSLCSVYNSIAKYTLYSEVYMANESMQTNSRWEGLPIIGPQVAMDTEEHF